MKLADRVRFMRKRRGWSQKELAARAGMSNAYVGLLERAGEPDSPAISDPKLSTIRALADTLGARPEWLAFGVGPLPPRNATRPGPLKRVRQGAA